MGSVVLDSVVMVMTVVLAVTVLVSQELVVVASGRIAVEEFPTVEAAVVDFAYFAASSEVHLEGMAGRLVSYRRRWNAAWLQFAEHS